jgi:hypothetical protein
MMSLPGGAEAKVCRRLDPAFAQAAATGERARAHGGVGPSASRQANRCADVEGARHEPQFGAANLAGAQLLQPHRMRQFTLSPDPEFVPRLRDIVGLSVDPLPPGYNESAPNPINA